MKYEREAFGFLVQVKMPRSFAEELNEAAASHLMSRSDFIRTTRADRLKNGGIENARAA
jgi:metal-responsive CopG/Arc/MetJ family transcriptional regulator